MKSNKRNVTIGFVILMLLVCGVYIIIEKNNLISDKTNTENIESNTDEQVLLASIDDNIRMMTSEEVDNKKIIVEEIQAIEEILSEPMMVLVNKENALTEDYVPDNLKKADFKFLKGSKNTMLEEEVAEAAKKMVQAAAKDGITLYGVSGYRSYDVQKDIYESRVVSKGVEQTNLYTAEPGTSEHQLGLALDIVSKEYTELEEGFKDTNSFKWLINNCYKYGFILRYQEGKEDITGYNYEPWHYRYIGNEDIAEEIMTKGIVLEEYINELQIKVEDLKKQL